MAKKVKTKVKAAKTKKAEGKKGKVKKAKTKKSSKRISWLRASTDTPLIGKYARKMKSYVTATADGFISDGELKGQEAVVAGLLRDVEPQLDDDLHGKVTTLLCEMAVYDMLQTMHTLQKSLKRTKFQG
jgi:hypothetical protein